MPDFIRPDGNIRVSESGNGRYSTPKDSRVGEVMEGKLIEYRYHLTGSDNHKKCLFRR